MTHVRRMSLLVVAVAVGAAGLSCRKSAPPASQPVRSESAPTTSPATAPTTLVATVPAAAPIDPNSFQGLMDRGNAATGAGNLAAAAELFSQAVERAGDPSSRLLALKGLANALTLAERTAEAADVYRSLLEADPSDRTTRFNLAVALTRLRHFSEAEAMYRQLLDERADFVQARYNLAALYQAQGKLAQARDEWRRVVDQAPQLASAQTALGEVLLQLGQVDAAQAAFDAATRIAKDDAAAWRGLALAAHAVGNLERALTAARRAAQLAEQDAATWRLLGDILLDQHRATGDRRHLEEAEDAWRRSLALDGTQEDLRRILEAAGGGTAQPGSRAAVDK